MTPGTQKKIEPDVQERDEVVDPGDELREHARLLRRRVGAQAFEHPTAPSGSAGSAGCSSRSGTCVKPSATGSYCTIPRVPNIVQVSTMSSPIASGQPPTARRSSRPVGRERPLGDEAPCCRPPASASTPLIPSR